MAIETGAAAVFEEGHGSEHLPSGMGELHSNAAAFALREHGMPFGEALLGKNRIAGLAAPYSSAAGFALCEHGMPFDEAFLGKNRIARLAAPYSNAAAFALREHGMPVGEALLGKNRIVGLAAPYSNADASEREHGVTLGEPLLGKNRAARLDAAPYSNPAVFAHPRGMAAAEALRATTFPPYVVQVSIDEAMGAKAGGPMVVRAKAAGADAGDVPGRGGSLSYFVGIVAASSAVTAVAAGAVSPAVTFGFFVVLLSGLSLVMSAVRGA